MPQHASLHLKIDETLSENLQKGNKQITFDKQYTHNQTSANKAQGSLLTTIIQNRISLNEKDQVESLGQNQSAHSEQIDIDEQNDIVNQLSFYQNLQKDDQQHEFFADFTIKDRILYANLKKQIGNQFFKQHNLEEAIQSYKIGLSLLKPEIFSKACKNDWVLMAELTSNILYNMGTCYFILMSFKHAIKYYDQAILIKPNYSKAIHNRALCYFQERNLRKAYDDIKMAFEFDKQNISIQTDLAKIKDQYKKIYSSQKNLNVGLLQELSDKKNLSKSMIQQNCKGLSSFISKQATCSMISCNKQDLQIPIKTQQEAYNNNDEMKKQAKCPQFLRKRTQTLNRKKFCLNHLKPQKNPKVYKNQKFQPSKSGKFRPYVINKSPNFLLKQQKQQKNENNQPLAQQPQRKIYIRRVKTENTEKLKSVRNDKDIKNTQKYWDYVPIFVATGFGIYHGFRAVFGK